VGRERRRPHLELDGVRAAPVCNDARTLVLERVYMAFSPSSDTIGVGGAFRGLVAGRFGVDGLDDPGLLGVVVALELACCGGSATSVRATRRRQPRRVRTSDDEAKEGGKALLCVQHSSVC
jgi:hypothetical protein